MRPRAGLLQTLLLAVPLLSGCSGEPVEPVEPVEPAVPDVCKPDGVTPEVIVGRGEYSYLVMMDGEVIQVVVPPQGGYVIWLALRQTGMRRAGSTTTATGRMDALDLDVGPSPVAYSFMPDDEEGYCRMYGLPLHIENARPISDMLGREMKVTVRVADEDGDAAEGTRIVTLSEDVF